MRRETASRLAWVVFACICGVVLTAVVFSVWAGQGVDPFAILVLTFSMVGALTASRQPRNAVGWVMLGVGVVGTVDGVLVTYAEYALTTNPGSLPRPDLALALSAPMWVPLIGLMGTFVILLFPDGGLPSSRWRPWAWFCAISMGLVFFGIMFSPVSFSDVGYPEIQNPLGLEFLRTDAGIALLLLIPASIVGCAVALVRRFRRSNGQERLQMKWLAGGAGLTATLYLFAMVGSFTTGMAWDDSGPVWLVVLQNVAAYSFVLIPIAVGIAILKYRLYDIDLIINRALVYGALTAALSATYFLVVALLQGLLRPFESESQLAIAGSTLVIAALFRPARSRLQAFIDRRFYRRKYDATRTLERFAARVRYQVDLDALAGELVALTHEAMQPRHVSLWLTPARSQENS